MASALSWSPINPTLKKYLGTGVLLGLDSGTGALFVLYSMTGALSGLNSGTGALSGLNSGTGVHNEEHLKSINNQHEGETGSWSL